MEINMNIKFFFCFLLFISFQPHIANSMITNDSFTDPSFGTGKKFIRKEGAAYLECYESRSFPERGFANRSFYIKPKDGEFKDKIVGKLGVKYDQKQDRVEIGVLEVNSQYRRKGYGEAAVRTGLGIYRSNSNNNLKYNHFFLTVSKDQNHMPARELYKKVGFVISEDLDKIGYLYMTLPR